jgi:hypothetical protein
MLESAASGARGNVLAEQTLRIFVSSPSDVAAERERVKLVAERLNAELEGVVHLDVLRWETIAHL